MILLPRTKPTTLLVYEALDRRMNMPSQHKHRFAHSDSGHTGEIQFDSLLEPYHRNSLVLNGLNLKQDDKEFQIDTCVLAQGTAHLFEVKNHSGQYTYKDGCIYSRHGYRVLNPLSQADRSESLLHNLLLSQGIRLPIKHYVMFVHPDFRLHPVPPNHSILFPNQLPYLFETLFPSHLSVSKQDSYVAQKILALHNPDYRPKNLPVYCYEKMEKGIFCKNCSSSQCMHTRQTRICTSCGHKETIIQAIYRNAEELRLLFPDLPLTTNLVYDWCGRVFSKDRIRYVLKKFYDGHSTGPGNYYTSRQKESC